MNPVLKNVFVVIPSWNGQDHIRDCLNSVKKQTIKQKTIVVDNGSVDDSVNIIRSEYPWVDLVELPKNTGFTGGVNTGIKRAMSQGADAVALFNNDAVADKDWLKQLVRVLDEDKVVGIATGALLQSDKKHVDSTGDIYTTWGLPYPRGRNTVHNTPNQANKTNIQYVFGASGGASLYRASMLQQIGLFDQSYFAYLEDVDISWRAQLAGWKVAHNPKAIAYHKIGGTSGKIKGFATYHYMKNLPVLFWKNVPLRFMPHILPRLWLAYWSIMAKSMVAGRGLYALKGYAVHMIRLPRTLSRRRVIQKTTSVSDDYIWSILTHDLPPNARNLRRLRSFFTGRD